METLAILGSHGFLGPHLVAAAVRRTPHRVVAVARTKDPVPVFHEEPGRVEAIEVDLTDRIERTLDVLRPRRVVLSAALSRVADCEREPERAQAVNADLPLAVARWCSTNEAHLVYLSTDLVFGGRLPRQARFQEDDPPAPLHVYGRTKAQGEANVLATWSRALVVRLPLLFGDSGGRGLGASDAILETLRAGRQPRLFEDEWRTPIDAENAAAAVMELEELLVNGFVHVAGPQRLSRYEFGLEVLRARGVDEEDARAALAKSWRAEAGLADQRPADVSLDSTRARGWLRTELLAPRVALLPRGEA